MNTFREKHVSINKQFASQFKDFRKFGHMSLTFTWKSAIIIGTTCQDKQFDWFTVLLIYKKENFIVSDGFLSIFNYSNVL